LRFLPVLRRSHEFSFQQRYLLAGEFGSRFILDLYSFFGQGRHGRIHSNSQVFGRLL
jgi:hypothetical protein